MNGTSELLQRYVENGSEDAFRQLVERHIGLVYATALRKMAGDAHAAQDVAQIVFSDLARKAHALPGDIVLAGWLYRHTCLKAAEAIRAESRRRIREQIAVEMKTLHDSDHPLWPDVAPVLDEAMELLTETDRDALVLRFFQDLSLRSCSKLSRSPAPAVLARRQSKRSSPCWRRFQLSN